MSERVEVKIRLKPALRDKLRKEAEYRGFSFSRECERRLEASLKKKKTPAPR
jgi:hypothetical protein